MRFCFLEADGTEYRLWTKRQILPMGAKSPGLAPGALKQSVVTDDQ
jgi:hypothetical protein